jgi:acyl carrier protein
MIKLTEKDFLTLMETVIKKKSKRSCPLTMQTYLNEVELDSLDKLEIMLELETKFNLSFSNLDELLQFNIIQDIYQFLLKEMKTGA